MCFCVLSDSQADVSQLGEENKQVRAELLHTKETLLDQLDSNHVKLGKNCHDCILS